MRPTIEIVSGWAPLGFTQDPTCVVLGHQLFEDPPNMRIFVELVGHGSPRPVMKLRGYGRRARILQGRKSLRTHDDTLIQFV